jgi:hypothetical protein
MTTDFVYRFHLFLHSGVAAFTFAAPSEGWA